MKAIFSHPDEKKLKWICNIIVPCNDCIQSWISVEISPNYFCIYWHGKKWKRLKEIKCSWFSDYIHLVCLVNGLLCSNLVMTFSWFACMMACSLVKFVIKFTWFMDCSVVRLVITFTWFMVCCVIKLLITFPWFMVCCVKKLVITFT